MKRKSDCSLKTLSPKDEPQVSKGIRTRLSTGTLIMSGTSTALPSEPHFQERPDSPSNSSSAGSDVNISHHSGGKDSVSPSRKRKMTDNKEFGEPSNIPPKRKKIGRNDGSGEGNKNDYFCWICHKEGVVIYCELCPRVFHAKCLSIENNVPQDWVCPECEKIMKAECTDTRSKTMSLISVSTLCTLLRYALDRMRTVGSETFELPVDSTSFPNYFDYVFHPMSLAVLEKNIKRKNYGCTEAFLADAKWIYHNSCVYNGAQNKITSVARSLLKVCKHEMSEIEVCPDCYYNSCLQSDCDWFCEPCRTPHPLVWAKLKGYPFWPAKALREVNDQVDVRFFGAHDRSWVPVASCFMLSKACPVMVKKGRGGMQEAMREVDVHIKKLRDKLGGFEYAPFRFPYSRDSVYSKLKSSDSGKNTGPGKVATKTKASDGRLGDKPSMVSKTAMALKSKYIGITSKKGSQPPGTVAKVGSTQIQQRQIIYLKPMPKGVFLLSEQVIEPVTGGKSSSTQGGASRSNIPDLQLVTSNKIQPTALPSTSATPLPSTSAMPLPSTSATPLPSTSATPLPSTSATPLPSTSSENELSHSKGRMKERLAKEIASKEEVAQLTDIVLKVGSNATNNNEVVVGKIEDCQNNNELTLSMKKDSIQNVLLSKEIASDEDLSTRKLTNPESEMFSNKIAVISDEKDDVCGSLGQDTSSEQNNQQKSMEADSRIDGESSRPDLVESALSSNNNTVSDSCEHVLKSSRPNWSVSTNNQREDNNESSDIHQEVRDYQPTSLLDSSSITISHCSDSNITEVANKKLIDNETTISGTNIDPSLASVENHNVVVVNCQEQTENSTDNEVRMVSPTTIHKTSEKSCSIDSDTVSNTNVHETILQPAEKEQCKEKAQLIRDCGESVQNVTVDSPSSCKSTTSLTVSASDASSIPTSVITLSPGSKYESLQKVIDSCAAKLGIDAKTLNNTENDEPFILECDFSEEEEGIVISDNDDDDDGQVLLMDVDVDNEEYVSTTLTKSTSNSGSTEEVSSTTGLILFHKSTQPNINFQSESNKIVIDTPSNKDILSKQTLGKQMESKNIESKKQNDSRKSLNPSDIITDLASSITTKHLPDRVIDLECSTNSTPSTYNKTASQNSASNCDGTSNVFTNIVIDKIVEKTTVTSLSASVTEDNIAITSKDAQVSKESSNSRAWTEQEPITIASKDDDAASIISIDDDDVCSILSDDVTLDMEVVCHDVPCEESEEDVETDNETSGDVVTLSNSINRKENSSTPARVLDNNPAHDVDKAPTVVGVSNAKQTQNIHLTLVSYPTLRGTLSGASATAVDTYVGNASLQSSKTNQVSTTSDTFVGNISLLSSKTGQVSTSDTYVGNASLQSSKTNQVSTTGDTYMGNISLLSSKTGQVSTGDTIMGNISLLSSKTGQVSTGDTIMGNISLLSSKTGQVSTTGDTIMGNASLQSSKTSQLSNFSIQPNTNTNSLSVSSIGLSTVSTLHPLHSSRKQTLIHHKYKKILK